MGHVDHRGLQPLVELNQLRPHGHPQLGVQVGQRLVHQEDLRLTHDGPPQRHALPLTTGKLLGLPREQLADTQQLRCVLHAPVNLALGRPPQLQAEREVVVHAHVRIQRVALEHHRDVAVLRRHVVHQALANEDVAVRHLFQARNQPQRSGLATARRPDQHEELAVAHLQRDIVDRHNLTKPLRQAVKRYTSHVSLSFTGCRRAKTELFGKSRSLPTTAGARGQQWTTLARHTSYSPLGCSLVSPRHLLTARTLRAVYAVHARQSSARECLPAVLPRGAEVGHCRRWTTAPQSLP